MPISQIKVAAIETLVRDIGPSQPIHLNHQGTKLKFALYSFNSSVNFNVNVQSYLFVFFCFLFILLFEKKTKH